MTYSLADVTLKSRFFLGTATYPSPKVLNDAIIASEAQVVTVGLKRQLAPGQNSLSKSTTDGVDNTFFQMLRQSGAHLLPNTAGCKTAREAIT